MIIVISQSYQSYHNISPTKWAPLCTVLTSLLWSWSYCLIIMLSYHCVIISCHHITMSLHHHVIISPHLPYYYLYSYHHFANILMIMKIYFHKVYNILIHSREKTNIVGIYTFFRAKLDFMYSVTLKGKTFLNSLCRQFCKKEQWQKYTAANIFVIWLCCWDDVAPVILLRYCRVISLILLSSSDMSLIGLWWSCD